VGKKKFGCGTLVLSFIAFAVISSVVANWGSEGENTSSRVTASSTQKPSATSTPRPSSTQSEQKTDSADPYDEACAAMKDADLAMATVGRKLLDGSATSGDSRTINSALEDVNRTYKLIDGDMYWYMVEQGNAMYLMATSLEDGDGATANFALESYLDGDEYTRYCR
jgi:hypothetical protein